MRYALNPPPGGMLHPEPATPMSRIATIERTTKETRVRLSLNLDGSGIYRIATSIPFFDHMLALFAKHGLLDLTVEAEGDTGVDDHHTVEDVGLCLGDAVAKALGERTGINRFGCFAVPMDEALAETALDLSGRPFVMFNVAWGQEKIKQFDVSLIEEFWRAFATRAQANLHIRAASGKDAHHVSEAIFKAVARALEMAVATNPRRAGVPSTKGTLTA